ncbi:hypothetical protein SASPL_137645 [Salvia splendens]|uniref:SMP domain-containing protein n=1 Tax=Salvia splendens TaxID=180675 RepID=A0A8X8ZDL1_SALSN|nr:hypothetical protein SASPL_137645 [Salvia splendens]
MAEYRDQLSEGSEDVIAPNDIFAQVVGKDKPGQVRMMGQGVCPSDVWNGTPINTSDRLLSEYREKIARLEAMLGAQQRPCASQADGRSNAIASESLSLRSTTAETDQSEKPKKFASIKYGNVFDVSGELAAKDITPQDAAAVESAEKSMFGETQKSGMASVMKSVAELNEERGVVGHDDTTETIREGGTQITETTVVGHRVISKSIGRQFFGRFAMDE